MKGKCTTAMYTMLHNHTKIPSAAFDLAPHSKTTTFCLSFCLHPSSMGDVVAGERKNAGGSLQPIRCKGKDLTNGSPPGHSLGNFYAGWREKQDKYFLQVRENIMLSKNFLSCEEINILSKWRELPRHIQGNKIVGKSFASQFLTVCCGVLHRRRGVHAAAFRK